MVNYAALIPGLVVEDAGCCLLENPASASLVVAHDSHTVPRGQPRNEPKMPKNITRVQVQLRSASDRSSKIIKDAHSIEAVVEVPVRATLALTV